MVGEDGDRLDQFLDEHSAFGEGGNGPHLVDVEVGEQAACTDVYLVRPKITEPKYGQAMTPPGLEDGERPGPDRGWDPMRYTADEPWQTQQSGRFIAGLAHRTRGTKARFALRVVFAAGLLICLAVIVSEMAQIL